MNSPSFHLQSFDGMHHYYHDFEVYVDLWGQVIIGDLLGKRLGNTLGSINLNHMPLFPLNTDGVDLALKDFEVARVKVTNFDDAVVVKPSHPGNAWVTCSEDAYIHDIEVWYGVGMSIGTVAPSDDPRCVNNVTFRNVTFHHPFKSVYIKTNPGDTTSMLPGSGGSITNILYEDLKIRNPIWYNIYVGP